MLHKMKERILSKTIIYLFTPYFKRIFFIGCNIVQSLERVEKGVGIIVLRQSVAFIYSDLCLQNKTQFRWNSITLYRSKKAKNINISIRPFKGVRVAVPRLASFRQAKQFVVLRKHWIEKHAAQMKQFEDRQTVFNWDTQFKTKYRTLN